MTIEGQKTQETTAPEMEQTSQENITESPPKLEETTPKVVEVMNDELNKEVSEIMETEEKTESLGQKAEIQEDAEMKEERQGKETI